MGICNPRHLNREIAKRKLVVGRYRENLKGIQGIKLCEPQLGVESNFAYFPLLFDDFKKSRDEVYTILKEYDIILQKTSGS